MATKGDQATLELTMGDLIHRTRAVEEALYGEAPYEHIHYDEEEGCFWYGDVAFVESNDKLAVDDADGFRMKEIEIPDRELLAKKEVVEHVRNELDDRLLSWNSNL